MGIRKQASLIRVYFTSFFGLVVLPILAVFVISLPVIHSIVKKQAIENITLAQSNIIANLSGEVAEMSMRLSHLIYTNDNEILNLAAGTDTDDADERYRYTSRLNEASRIALVPLSDIVSVGFYMKSGRTVMYKSEVNIAWKDLTKTAMYQYATQHPNIVGVGGFNTDQYHNIYTGSAGGALMLVAGFVPDVRADRSERIGLITLYELSTISRIIQRNDEAYLAGKNSLGCTALVDKTSGAVQYASEIDRDLLRSALSGSIPAGYTFLTSPVSFPGADWELATLVRTGDLTRDFNTVALVIVLVVFAILLFFFLFSLFFLKNIINPIARMREGMKQVEDGDLETHIAPEGNGEIRAMIHSFNAMVRRIKALITDYQHQVRMRERARTPEMVLQDLVDGKDDPKEACERGVDFFHDPYVLIGFVITVPEGGKATWEGKPPISQSFDRIPRFALRCTLATIEPGFLVAYYRIDRALRRDKLQEMLEMVVKTGNEEYGVDVSVIISAPTEGWETFRPVLADLSRKRVLLPLYGQDSILSLDSRPDFDLILSQSDAFHAAAAALYIADEKTVAQTREALSAQLRDGSLAQGKVVVLGFVLACSRRFHENLADLSDAFGRYVPFVQRIESCADVRSLALWLNNFITKVFEYAVGTLDLGQQDVVTKAKRYIADNYMRPDLSLGDVAGYVGLNEKYFTTKFSALAGETFQSYVTELRIAKAKELIRTTTFKMYEVAQMVGYANAEHFNRIFRKEVGMSPHHYRNDQISEDTTTKSVDKSGESPGETDETSRIVT